MRRLDFRDHRRQLDDNQHVYAVVSRRAQGLSIGVNLNADKVCNFDCPYCQVDRRVPGGPSAVDTQRVHDELAHLLGLVAEGRLWSVAPFDTAAPHLRVVRDISFAGDGEPTTSKAFGRCIELVGGLRARFGLDRATPGQPPVAVRVLTNATLFHRPRVQTALAQLDALDGEIWAKLDAGTQAWFERVDGTTLPLERIVANLLQAARVRPIVLQCMWHGFDGVGPSDQEIAAWAQRIDHILRNGGAIKEVQVYTIARAPADAAVTPLSPEELAPIAAAARAVGAEARVF